MLHINRDTNTYKSGSNSIFYIFNPFVMWIYLTVAAKNKVYLLRKFHFAPDKANTIYKGKLVPLHAWSGPEGSRKLRFLDFMTTAQEGCKVEGLTHQAHLPPGKPTGTHFCYRLSRPQGHSVIGRIMSMKNSNDTIWDRTSDLPICSTAPYPLCHHGPWNNVIQKLM